LPELLQGCASEDRNLREFLHLKLKVVPTFNR